MKTHLLTVLMLGTLLSIAAPALTADTGAPEANAEELALEQARAEYEAMLIEAEEARMQALEAAELAREAAILVTSSSLTYIV